MKRIANEFQGSKCPFGYIEAIEQKESRAKVVVRWMLDHFYKVVLVLALVFMFTLILALCKVLGAEGQWIQDVMAAVAMLALLGAFGLVELLGKWAGTDQDEVGWWHPRARRTTWIAIIGFSLALILALTISVYNVIGTSNAAEADRRHGLERDERARWQATPEVQAATENMERVRELRERAATRRALPK